MVTTSAPEPAELILLVACRLPARPSLLFVTANREEAVPFALDANTPPGPVAIFQVAGQIPDGHMALISPFTRTYLTAPVFAPDGCDAAAITSVAEHLGEWESFTTHPVATAGLYARVLRQLAAIDHLLSLPLTCEKVFTVLASFRDGGALLDAALPLMPTGLLDELGHQLMEDAGTRRRLAMALPGDLWAAKAMPALAAWHFHRGDVVQASKRGGPSAHEAAVGYPLARSTRRVIGPDLDVLGTINPNGRFSSFGQACVLRARRRVRPQRNVALVATARNEGVYLLEWLAYHRLLGFEAFYLYSNDNDDGSDQLLGALADAGVITWIDSKLNTRLGNAQFKAYGHALGFMPDLLDFAWVLAIDLDEFLVLDRARFPVVGDFCDWLSERGAGTVALNWQYIGSAETEQTVGALVTQRNRRVLTAAQVGEGVRLVKSMSRPNKVVQSEAHVPFVDERSGLCSLNALGTAHSWHNPPAGYGHERKFADRIITGPAVVNHYMFKSAAECLWKASRNTGDRPVFEAGKIGVMQEQRAIEFLVQADALGLAEDSRAMDGVPGLQAELQRLRQLPGVADALSAVLASYDARLLKIRDTYRHSSAVKEWGEPGKRFLSMAGINDTA